MVFLQMTKTGEVMGTQAFLCLYMKSMGSETQILLFKKEIQKAPHHAHVNRSLCYCATPTSVIEVLSAHTKESGNWHTTSLLTLVAETCWWHLKEAKWVEEVECVNQEEKREYNAKVHEMATATYVRCLKAVPLELWPEHVFDLPNPHMLFSICI